MSNFWIDADSGDDANDGSEGSPWETLVHAIDNSVVSDTINVVNAVATYAWVTDEIPSRTIKGDDVDQCVFDAGGQNAQVGWSFQGANIIQNLTFTNNGYADYASYFYSNIFGGKDTSGNTALFERCKMHNMTMRSSSINWYTGALFGSAGAGSGFQLNSGQCVYTLNSCEIWDIKSSTSAAYAHLFMLSSTGGITFNNCSIYINGTGTAQLNDFGKCGIADLVYYNNTIVQNAGDSIEFYDVAQVGKQPAGYNSCTNGFSNGPSGTTNITTDPLYHDPANGDFRLKPASGCLDEGGLI